MDLFRAGEAIEVAAGATTTVEVAVPTRRLAAWDDATNAWTWEPGRFALRAGVSSVELGAAVTLEITE